MVPSVIPDFDFDDMEIVQTVAKSFAVKNHELEQERPQQFQNVRLYYKLAVRFAQEKQIAAQPPPMPGPPQLTQAQA